MPRASPVWHWNPLVVPPQVPERSWPGAQSRLEQSVHAVSGVPVHPPLLYLPVPQAAQARHAPGLAPARY